MKWKQIIALICLLVLSTQVLPLKQLGALLSSNQVNEELPHATDDGTDVAKFDFSKLNPFLPSRFSVSHLFESGAQEYFHFAISLPACHAGEIHTPPPNFIA